jgi:hypothetical protein
MGISLKPQHLNRYRQIAWLFMKYGRSDLVKTSGILAALIVGAAMLIRVETSFRIWGYPGLAIILFLLAAGGGIALLINILFYDKAGRN